MFRLASAAVAATLSFTSMGAEPTTANGEHATLAALSARTAGVSAGAAASAASLDEYAGVYESADGATFVVVRDGDSLTVELPDSIALPIRAAGPSFVVDTSLVRIAFESDAGNSARLVLSQSSGETVVATRLPLRRGIVTIHDI
jgi:hypothetical protein